MSQNFTICLLYLIKASPISEPPLCFFVPSHMFCLHLFHSLLCKRRRKVRKFTCNLRWFSTCLTKTLELTGYGKIASFKPTHVAIFSLSRYTPCPHLIKLLLQAQMQGAPALCSSRKLVANQIKMLELTDYGKTATFQSHISHFVFNAQLRTLPIIGPVNITSAEARYANSV